LSQKIYFTVTILLVFAHHIATYVNCAYTFSFFCYSASIW